MRAIRGEGDQVFVSEGFREDERMQVAGIYRTAFAGKLRVALWPLSRSPELIAQALNPDHAIIARSGDGSLLGVAGYRTAGASFVRMDFALLSGHFGLFGALWRGVLLSVLEWSPEAGSLLMDGLFVADGARGRGVGSALLDAIKAKARDLGCPRVRLDVVDTNRAARRLYERSGFRPMATRSVGPLSIVFGFRRVTTMMADVAAG
jgi:GNAT superfamily N-acetyltransferase